MDFCCFKSKSDKHNVSHYKVGGLPIEAPECLRTTMILKTHKTESCPLVISFQGFSKGNLNPVGLILRYLLSY